MKHLVQNKKALSMALAAALAIAPVNAFAASNDIRGHWAEKTITQWQDSGLIGGYQDGTFKPDKPATRAEFARIMNQALGLNHKGNVSFSDVSSSDWFYNDVAIAMGEQYTAGYPDGTFKPNEIITRAQAAAFIAKALGASGGSLASFKDASSIPAWAQGAVGGIVEKGYMSGYPDGTFRPNAVLTRAEAVSTLNRIMGVKPVEEETKKVEKDVVIDQSGTKLKDQTIEGNLTISDKVGSGKVTLSNVEIKGDLIIQGGGENSVYLDNTTVEGKTVMDKKNVRLELSGKTKLPNVEIKKACNLTTSNFSGEVKRISITSSISDKTTIGVAAEKLYVESKADLYITKDIDQVVVEKDAAGTKIEVGSNSKVSTLTADGKISLNGKGKVSTLEANVDGITYASDITITKTETAKGVDKPEKTNKNGTGGGSSSDSSSSSKKSVSEVEITGTAVVGAKLTATTTPSAATGTYRWQKCSTKNGTYTNISGATGSTYTVVSDDEGKYIRVVFTASGKYKGTQTSTATAIGVAVVPSVKVTALAFTDTDTQASKMGGKLTWTAPTNVSNVTGYVVYASADGTTKGAKLGEVAVGTNELAIAANTAYAAHIIVVAKNATGEAANYASVAVTDVVATATPVISGTPKAGDTTISGTCVDGATVAVSINGGAAKAATVTGTNWTIAVPALVAGNTISVVATKAPNTASTAATATVAALAPTDAQKVATAKTAIQALNIAWDTDLTTTITKANEAIGTVTLPAGVTAVAAEGIDANAGKVVVTIISGSETDTTIVITEAATLSSITITTPATKTAYKVGETLDITGMVVTGTYSDTSTKVVTVTAGNVTGFDSSAVAASQTLTVTVNGKTATYTISVAKADGPALTGVTADDAANTLTGMATGMEFSVNGTDWTAYNAAEPNLPDLTGTVALQVRVAATATHEAGAATTFNFTEAAVTLASIAITTPATKTAYKVGETLDISGMVITGTYSDSSTKTETIQASDVTGFDSSAVVASQTLTVTVNGKTATYTISVAKADGPALTGVTADDAANTLTGMATGMEFSVNGTDWTAYNAAEPNLPDLTGTVALQVRVAATATHEAGAATTFNFTEAAVTLASIAITTPATKTAYKVGETLDISGMVITGTYSDSSTKTETIQASDVTGFDSSAVVASQTLTVTVNGKTATYTISVAKADGPALTGVTADDAANTLTGMATGMEFSVNGTDWTAYNAAEPNLPDLTGTVALQVRVAATATHEAGAATTFNFTEAAVTLASIAITTPATKTAYKVGETLDISGMVITGTYSDSSTKTETIQASDVTGFDSSAVVASQTLTVTVNGKTATYTISVAKADGPALTGVTADDAANTLTGMATGMEFSVNGTDWTAYNAAEPNLPDLTGTVALQVRVAATATHEAGAATTFNFTA